MAEILFYHLTEKTLEAVLPGLVEKSLSRGWKVVIQAGSAERIEALDNHLWTYREESFLAHGRQQNGTEHLQPVWLCTDEGNPNGAKIRFLVDGGELDDLSGYDRVVYIFDGHNNTSVDHARSRWKFHKDGNADSGTEHELTYWQQTPTGGWEKKA